MLEKPFKVVITTAVPMDPFLKDTLVALIKQSPLVTQEPQFYFEVISLLFLF